MDQLVLLTEKKNITTTVNKKPREAPAKKSFKNANSGSKIKKEFNKRVTFAKRESERLKQDIKIPRIKEEEKPIEIKPIELKPIELKPETLLHKFFIQFSKNMNKKRYLEVPNHFSKLYKEYFVPFCTANEGSPCDYRNFRKVIYAMFYDSMYDI